LINYIQQIAHLLFQGGANKPLAELGQRSRLI
jgi:hypothetical protein